MKSSLQSNDGKIQNIAITIPYNTIYLRENENRSFNGSLIPDDEDGGNVCEYTFFQAVIAGGECKEKDEEGNISSKNSKSSKTYDKLKYMINKEQIDLVHKNENGDNSLHLAVQTAIVNNDIAVLMLILHTAKKYDVLDKVFNYNKDGIGPLHLPTKQKKEKIIELLLQYVPVNFIINDPDISNNIDLIKNLLEKSKKNKTITKQDLEGNNILHNLIRKGDAELYNLVKTYITKENLKILLKQHNNLGHKPLTYATLPKKKLYTKIDAQSETKNNLIIFQNLVELSKQLDDFSLITDTNNDNIIEYLLVMSPYDNNINNKPHYINTIINNYPTALIESNNHGDMPFIYSNINYNEEIYDILYKFWEEKEKQYQSFLDDIENYEKILKNENNEEEIIKFYETISNKLTEYNWNTTRILNLKESYQNLVERNKDILVTKEYITNIIRNIHAINIKMNHTMMQKISTEQSLYNFNNTKKYLKYIFNLPKERLEKILTNKHSDNIHNNSISNIIVNIISIHDLTEIDTDSLQNTQNLFDNFLKEMINKKIDIKTFNDIDNYNIFHYIFNIIRHTNNNATLSNEQQQICQNYMKELFEIALKYFPDELYQHDNEFYLPYTSLLLYEDELSKNITKQVLQLNDKNNHKIDEKAFNISKLIYLLSNGDLENLSNNEDLNKHFKLCAEENYVDNSFITNLVINQANHNIINFLIAKLKEYELLNNNTILIDQESGFHLYLNTDQRSNILKYIIDIFDIECVKNLIQPITTYSDNSYTKNLIYQSIKDKDIKTLILLIGIKPGIISSNFKIYNNKNNESFDGSIFDLVKHNSNSNSLDCEEIIFTMLFTLSVIINELQNQAVSFQNSEIEQKKYIYQANLLCNSLSNIDKDNEISTLEILLKTYIINHSNLTKKLLSTNITDENKNIALFHMNFNIDNIIKITDFTKIKDKELSYKLLNLFCKYGYENNAIALLEAINNKRKKAILDDYVNCASNAYNKENIISTLLKNPRTTKNTSSIFFQNNSIETTKNILKSLSKMPRIWQTILIESDFSTLKSLKQEDVFSKILVQDFLDMSADFIIDYSIKNKKTDLICDLVYCCSKYNHADLIKKIFKKNKDTNFIKNITNLQKILENYNSIINEPFLWNYHQDNDQKNRNIVQIIIDNYKFHILENKVHLLFEEYPFQVTKGKNKESTTVILTIFEYLSTYHASNYVTIINHLENKENLLKTSCSLISKSNVNGLKLLNDRNKNYLLTLEYLNVPFNNTTLSGNILEIYLQSLKLTKDGKYKSQVVSFIHDAIINKSHLHNMHLIVNAKLLQDIIQCNEINDKDVSNILCNEKFNYELLNLETIKILYEKRANIISHIIKNHPEIINNMARDKSCDQELLLNIIKKCGNIINYHQKDLLLSESFYDLCKNKKFTEITNYIDTLPQSLKIQKEVKNKLQLEEQQKKKQEEVQRKLEEQQNKKQEEVQRKLEEQKKKEQEEEQRKLEEQKKKEQEEQQRKLEEQQKKKQVSFKEALSNAIENLDYQYLEKNKAEIKFYFVQNSSNISINILKYLSLHQYFIGFIAKNYLHNPNFSNQLLQHISNNKEIEQLYINYLIKEIGIENTLTYYPIFTTKILDVIDDENFNLLINNAINNQNSYLMNIICGTSYKEKTFKSLYKIYADNHFEFNLNPYYKIILNNDLRKEYHLFVIKSGLNNLTNKYKEDLPKDILKQIDEIKTFDDYNKISNSLQNITNLIKTELQKTEDQLKSENEAEALLLKLLNLKDKVGSKMQQLLQNVSPVQVKNYDKIDKILCNMLNNISSDHNCMTKYENQFITQNQFINICLNKLDKDFIENFDIKTIISESDINIKYQYINQLLQQLKPEQQESIEIYDFMNYITSNNFNYNFEKLYIEYNKDNLNDNSEKIAKFIYVNYSENKEIEKKQFVNITNETGYNKKF
jgi:hypothetical protein